MLTAKEALQVSKDNEHRILFDRIDKAALQGLTHIQVFGLTEKELKLLQNLGYSLAPDGVLSWKDAK